MTLWEHLWRIASRTTTLFDRSQQQQLRIFIKNTTVCQQNHDGNGDDNIGMFSVSVRGIGVSMFEYMTWLLVVRLNKLIIRNTILANKRFFYVGIYAHWCTKWAKPSANEMRQNGSTNYSNKFCHRVAALRRWGGGKHSLLRPWGELKDGTLSG